MVAKKKHEPEVVIDIFGKESEVPEEIDESEFKRKRIGLFDFMNDLNSRKVNILRQDPLAEKDFAPYIINRGMSMGIDTVLYANEMNIRCGLDKQMVYDFYIFAIRPGKRYNKWAKSVDDKTVDLIREYYQLSLPKAYEALAILTDADIEDIKNKMNKGTVSSKRKNKP